MPVPKKLLDYVARNPGMQGNKIPKQFRNQLAPAEKAGLLTYATTKGWHLTEEGWSKVNPGNDSRRMN